MQIDPFDLASMADGIQGYRQAKKQRNAIEAAKKQREVENTIAMMQEKRLRGQMLGVQQAEQQRLGLEERRVGLAEELGRGQFGIQQKQSELENRLKVLEVERAEKTQQDAIDAIKAEYGLTSEQFDEWLEERGLRAEERETRREEAITKKEEAISKRRMMPLQEQAQESALMLQNLQNTILQKYITEHGETPELTKLNQELTESNARVNSMIAEGNYRDALADATREQSKIDKELAPLRIVEMKRKLDLTEAQEELIGAQREAIYEKLALEQERFQLEWLTATGRNPFADKTYATGEKLMIEAIKESLAGHDETAKTLANNAVDFYTGAGLDVQVDFIRDPRGIWRFDKQIPRFSFGQPDEETGEEQLTEEARKGREERITPSINKEETISEAQMFIDYQVGKGNDPLVEARNSPSMPKKMLAEIERLVGKGAQGITRKPRDRTPPKEIPERFQNRLNELVAQRKNNEIDKTRFDRLVKALKSLHNLTDDQYERALAIASQ